MIGLRLSAARPRQLQKLARALLGQCAVRDGCLIWTGERIQGIPMLRINGERRMARRVVWEMTHATAVGYRGVLSTCGRALCMRPDHLKVTKRGAALRTGMPAACDRL